MTTTIEVTRFEYFSLWIGMVVVYSGAVTMSAFIVYRLIAFFLSLLIHIENMRMIILIGRRENLFKPRRKETA